ncbi:MAG: bifunctional DedA family/phosphatase PAP2 family protein [Dermatophilus congolensis]|nr:bifunctional DedA family/phosphatase PAP2 family protein [Dermatophilus congolensis]
MSHVVATLLSLSGWPVYAVVGLLVFLEASAFIGLIFPGETALVVGGVLASRGNVSLPVLVAVGMVCAVAGDSVGYEIGRHFGPAIQRSRLGRWVGEEKWAAAHAYVESKGSGAVFLGRWVGVMRALVPSIAGMIRMPYPRFLLANMAGGATWVGVVLALSYTAGGSVETARKALGNISLIGGAVVVLVVAALVIRHRRRARLRSASVAAGGVEEANATGIVTSPESRHVVPQPAAVDNSTWPETVGGVAEPNTGHGATGSEIVGRAAPAETPNDATSPYAGGDVPQPTGSGGALAAVGRTMPVLRPWVAPAALTAAGLLAAVELADAVREGDDLVRLDPTVTAGAISERTPVLTAFAQAFTFLGSTAGVVLVTVVVIGWLLWRRRCAHAGVFAATMVASAGLTVLLKDLVARLRPPAVDVLGDPATSFAFPSGHTLNSTVLFGLIAGLALMQVRSTAARVGIVLTWLAASVAVGLSRVYLGYHWMTDVMGGWSIGLVVLGVLALGGTAVAVTSARSDRQAHEHDD